MLCGFGDTRAILIMKELMNSLGIVRPNELEADNGGP